MKQLSRKINYVLKSFFNTTEDGVRGFCQAEYGSNWQAAYSHYQKNKKLPVAGRF